MGSVLYLDAEPNDVLRWLVRLNGRMVTVFEGGAGFTPPEPIYDPAESIPTLPKSEGQEIRFLVGSYWVHTQAWPLANGRTELRVFPEKRSGEHVAGWIIAEAAKAFQSQAASEAGEHGRRGQRWSSIDSAEKAETLASQCGDEKADSAGFVAIRRLPLSLDLWPDVGGREVSVALAALKRISAYWEAAVSHRFFVAIWDDDGLYALLYHDLFWAIRLRPSLGHAEALLQELVPDALPDSDLALVMDDEIRGWYRDNFTKAQRILQDLAMAEGGSLRDDLVEPWFAMFDAEIKWRRDEALRQGDAESRRLRLLPPCETPPKRSGAAKPQLTRPQRRRAANVVKARALREEGRTIKEIASVLGVNVRTVHNYLGESAPT